MKAALLPILFFIAMAGYSQSASLRSANRYYQEQKYQEAVSQYQKTLSANAPDAVPRFNLGNAYFRLKNYEEAASTYEQLSGPSTETSLRQRSTYNKGVSFSKQDKLEESIAAYKEALKMDPTDADARINLQKALLELKKRQPQEQEKKQQPKKQQNQDQSKQQNKSNLSKKEVEQMLRALQQREQQVQQKMQQNMNRSAGRQEKDW